MILQLPALSRNSQKVIFPWNRLPSTPLGSTISATAARTCQLAPGSITWVSQTPSGWDTTRQAAFEVGLAGVGLPPPSRQVSPTSKDKPNPLSSFQATSRHLDLDFPNGKPISLEETDIDPRNRVSFRNKGAFWGDGRFPARVSKASSVLTRRIPMRTREPAKRHRCRSSERTARLEIPRPGRETSRASAPLARLRPDKSTGSSHAAICLRRGSGDRSRRIREGTLQIRLTKSRRWRQLLRGAGACQQFPVTASAEGRVPSALTHRPVRGKAQGPRGGQPGASTRSPHRIPAWQGLEGTSVRHPVQPPC